MLPFRTPIPSNLGAIAAGTGGVTLTASGSGADVTLGSTVSGNSFAATAGTSGAIRLNDGAATIVTTSGGGQSYNSPITLLADATLSDTGNGAISLNGQVTGGANSLTLSNGTGAQSLNGVTTSGDLVLATTGTVTLNGGTYSSRSMPITVRPPWGRRPVWSN